MCIEFYFDIECLNTKVDGFRLELVPQSIIVKCGNIEINRKEPAINTELHMYKPKKNTKAYFAEKVVPTLPDDKFNNFKVLFEQILDIINVHNAEKKILNECAVFMENIETVEDN